MRSSHLSELDLCIYFMSSSGIKMEVEDGTSATCGELMASLIEEEELNLPRFVTYLSNQS